MTEANQTVQENPATIPEPTALPVWRRVLRGLLFLPLGLIPLIIMTALLGSVGVGIGMVILMGSFLQGYSGDAAFSAKTAPAQSTVQLPISTATNLEASGAPSGVSQTAATSPIVWIGKQILLWMGAAFFAVAAWGRYDQSPGSKAAVAFFLAAVLLAPPFRFLIGQLSPLLVSARVTSIVVSAIWAFGLVSMSNDVDKVDVEAMKKGFKSNAEMLRAHSHDLKTNEELFAFDERQKKLAEEQAAAAAGLERWRQREAKAAELKKEADCKANLQCWGDKNSLKATFACRGEVENIAKFQFKWVDSLLETKFYRFRWLDASRGQITYVGDKIEFQNAFGVWVPATYYCDYDPDANLVLNVSATEGRMPR